MKRDDVIAVSSCTEVTSSNSFQIIAHAHTQTHTHTRRIFNCCSVKLITRTYHSSAGWYHKQALEADLPLSKEGTFPLTFQTELNVLLSRQICFQAAFPYLVTSGRPVLIDNKRQQQPTVCRLF